ncbi:MAG: LAGLIDADG family homing endonuclease [Acidimicrobiia bacterium]|nr:LAGLIDADG family homing endonuclease [Acidimicrobiia bacterium]
MRPATDLAAFVAGLVAGEGTFTVTQDPPKFGFAVALGASDGRTLRILWELFEAGTIHSSPRRAAHHDDVVCFQVRRLRDLVEVVVPFMDEHLPPSHKRRQYLAWRERLLDHWEHRARRRRPCTVDGCDAPRRAHGLCRRHLYRRHGV